LFRRLPARRSAILLTEEAFMPPTKRTAETMAKGDTKTGASRKEEPKIRRTLHFRFTLSGATEQMIAMIKSSAPMYQMFTDAKVRLLQNVDDPSRFLQEIEYDAPESLELNRQQLASDPRVQTYMMAWRSMFPGAVEIDVFKVV
jgi:hypothetical protein